MSLKNTVLVREGNLKRIAITCKCGVRTVHAVPGEIIMGGAIPILECPTCKQQYKIEDNKLERISDLHKLIQPDVEKIPVSAEAMDSDVAPRSDVAWNMPGSKAVN